MKAHNQSSQNLNINTRASFLSSSSSSTLPTPNSHKPLGNHIKESTNTNYQKEVSLQPPAALAKILQKIQITEAHLLTSTKRIDKK